MKATTPKPAAPTERYGPGYISTFIVTDAAGVEHTAGSTATFRKTLEACPGFRGFRVERKWSYLTRLESK